jgi:endonuclease G
MRRNLLAVGLIAIVTAATGSQALAQCSSVFADGKAPEIERQAMAVRTTMLCNEDYASLASGLTKGALWSAEHLTAESVAAAKQQPRTGRFHEESRIPASDRGMTADYARSGYDRGHMTPSGDMPSQHSQEETFTLANMVPQTPQLNRGVWEAIEEAVRSLAIQDGSLYVVTGPAFVGSPIKYVGDDRVLVPTSTWKAIYDPKNHDTGVYVCKNDQTPHCSIHTVIELVRQTGIDPFPSVSVMQKSTIMLLPKPEPHRYSH